MSQRRQIRRLAMQLLYQIDLRGEADLEAIRLSLTDGQDPPEVCEPAFNLARDAWAARAKADQIATELAPTWPTSRQPPVDRAILRLAFFEMDSGLTPVKVAINEAVELAKDFAAEQSPPFINGVLDKMAKRRGNKDQGPGTNEEQKPPSAPHSLPTTDH
jgi:transcription antitermination protein NusB